MHVAAGSGDVKPKLRELLEALTPVCSTWYNIGLAMKLEPGILNSIQTQCNDQESSLREMLRRRMNEVDPPLSWPIVVDALRQRYVNQIHVAKKIEDAHVHGKYTPSWQ